MFFEGLSSNYFCSTFSNYFLRSQAMKISLCLYYIKMAEFGSGNLSNILFSLKSFYPSDSVVSVMLWKMEGNTFFWLMEKWKVQNMSLFFPYVSVSSFKAL